MIGKIGRLLKMNKRNKLIFFASFGIIFFIIMICSYFYKKKAINDLIEINNKIAQTIESFDKKDFIKLQYFGKKEYLYEIYLFYRLNDCYPCIEKANNFIHDLNKYPENQVNIVFIYDNLDEINDFVSSMQDKLKGINCYMCTSKKLYSINIRVTPFLFIKNGSFKFSYIFSSEQIIILKKMLKSFNIRS